jgi:serine/threonine-protein kinase HipA
MPAILNLLKASDVPETDQTTFLKAQIAFWLMAATDGHAKNFSLFLSPGGRFRMAPLYDVISAQPSADAGQVRRGQLELAMAVGDNRHYVIGEIAPRHFIQTAARAGIGKAVVDTALAEVAANMPRALEEVIGGLPAGFPGSVAASIDSGVRSRLRLLDR